MPLSPDLFTRASAPGMAIKAGPEFPLTDRLGLFVSIAHSRFPMAGHSAFGVDAMTAWSISSDFIIRLRPASSTIQPYVTFGSGLYRLNHTPERVVIVCLGPEKRSNIIAPCPPPYVAGSGGPKVHLGGQAGVGASVPVMPMLRAFVESTYIRLFSDNGDVQYLSLQIGIRYHPVP